MSESYVIGTRGSMLAVAQCELIKKELEEKTGHQFTLKKIKTQGDLDTSKPLWQMDGKDFFTKELDHALLNHEVDLVVHSYKDLGSERPNGIKLASITKRNFGEDILLIKKQTIKNLKNQKEFTVGTSSPRRIVNVEKNLSNFLPNRDTKVKTAMLRGNVNTRIEKLLRGEFDAIILAFAGLERLATHPDTKNKVKELLTDLDFMIMPQSVFPSAASQGALAIEIASNREHHTLLEVLKSVEDDQTVSEMKIERSRFQNYGGGCHLAVGIHAETVKDFTFVSERGAVDDKPVNFVSLVAKRDTPPKANNVFLGYGSGDGIDQKVIKDKITKYESLTEASIKGGHLFVTSARCLNSIYSGEPIWVSGSMTHKKAMEAGYWVRGSADNLGHKKIHHYLNSNLIKLITGLNINDLKTLTGKGNKVSQGKTFEVYDRNYIDHDEQYKNEIAECGIFYWASFHQYQKFKEIFKNEISANALHCCGVGKTFDQLKEHEKVTAFYNLEEFKNWLKE